MFFTLYFRLVEMPPMQLTGSIRGKHANTVDERCLQELRLPTL
jgi:hypothetical protein